MRILRARLIAAEEEKAAAGHRTLAKRRSAQLTAPSESALTTSPRTGWPTIERASSHTTLMRSSTVSLSPLFNPVLMRIWQLAW